MPLNSPLVLVVEDDPDIAVLYQALLQAEGLEVALCSNRKQALLWWSQSARLPCLVVIDVRLPDCNGLELCQELMERPESNERPAVLVLSAHGDPRLPLLCRRAGASAFLDKLSGQDLFLSTVRQLVGNHLRPAP